jgi:exodeoxyribonuclease VII large subunit
MDDPGPNVPEFSVSEISGAIKSTLEGAFGRVRVRGEVTEVRRYASGHTYFSLKDEGGKLSAILWKGAAARAGLKPEDGMEVIATGRITAYGDRSSYQIIIERLDYAGAGALLARIEALRAKLTAEGLFEADRKRALPMLPDVVGVVTSEQGAVIQDIRTTIARRFPRRILLWPVPVQGEGAAEKVAAAIRGFDALPRGGPIPRPDVLIVARGGGSLEDLMAFNDEGVIRAVAECRIPLISAVGHETDTTLIDFASDRRAPTPTAAAELAVPSRSELAAQLAQTGARLLGGLGRLMQERRLRLQRAERGLPDLGALLATWRQRLDDRAERLRMALPRFVATKGERLPVLSERLRGGLRQSLAKQGTRAAAVLTRLRPAPLQARLREARARIEGLAARLASVSHEQVLARGYALVLDRKGNLLARAAAIAPGMGLTLKLADGEVAATADDGKPRQATLPL